MNLDFPALPAMACVVSGDLRHFGDVHAEARAALTSDVIAPLSHLSLLQTSGADADSFLQGQLSNDLRKLTPDRAQLAAYSSPKGRMLAVLHLTRSEHGAVQMELHRDIAESVQKRLRMFVMRSKVELQDRSELLSSLGLAGPQAAASLQALGLPAPAEVDATQIKDAIQVVRRAGAIPRYSLRAAPDQIARLWPELSSRAQPVGSDAWRLLDIEAGVAVVYLDTQDHFVAQMANLDRRSGISFEKGCYTGQEVIARLHHLGTLKRRLFLADVGVDWVAPGTSIHVEGEAAGAGEVVDAAPAADTGQHRLSFVLQLSHANASLRLGNPDGPPLSNVTAADKV